MGSADINAREFKWVKMCGLVRWGFRGVNGRDEPCFLLAKWYMSCRERASEKVF